MNIIFIKTVDEYHLEVEAKHCKGGIVGKRGSRPKEKTIGQIQQFDFLKIEKLCSKVVVVLLLLMLLLSLLVVFLCWCGTYLQVSGGAGNVVGDKIDY